MFMFANVVNHYFYLFFLQWEFGVGSLPTRCESHRRSNQINHTAHNNLARGILQAECQPAVGSSASRAGPASPRPPLLPRSGLVPQWAG